MSPTTIEDDLRSAFRAAAETVQPTRAALRNADPIHRPPRRRWVVPAVAAAVAVAVGAPIVTLVIARNVAGPDIAAASVVQTDGDTATVAGIAFPVPDGWRAEIVGHDTTSVTVCVATEPAKDCAGVTLHIAVPNALGKITPVSRQPATLLGGCGSSNVYLALLDQLPIGGRPAVHTHESCSSDGPRTETWMITDGSLSVIAPPAVALQTAVEIVAGLDFTNYSHAYGPTEMFFQEATTSAAAPTGPTS